jgi:O-methyltransferase
MDGAVALRYILDNNIEGAIVECGVFQGNFEYIWIQELQKANKLRDIYMYDTFAGLTEPSEYDKTCCDSILFHRTKDEVMNDWKSQIIDQNTNGWCYESLSYVKKRLNSTNYPQNKLHYIVGDVRKTLLIDKNKPDKIAILRLDTDWYDSTKVELQELYDRVVKGGVIIFDDYYHWDGQRKAVDEYFSKIGINYQVQSLYNGQCGSIIKI